MVWCPSGAETTSLEATFAEDTSRIRSRSAGVPFAIPSNVRARERRHLVGRCCCRREQL
jgi:hypothetical protein